MPESKRFGKPMIARPEHVVKLPIEVGRLPALQKRVVEKHVA